MAWSFNEQTPVYIQIADRLRNDIIKGEYAPGEQIPTVRQLAVTAAVNPNTVQRALAALEAEGLIHAQGTNGRFVTDDREMLDLAARTAVKKLVDDFLGQAKQMCVSRAELIKMIEEEWEF